MWIDGEKLAFILANHKEFYDLVFCGQECARIVKASALSGNRCKHKRNSDTRHLFVWLPRSQGGNPESSVSPLSQPPASHWGLLGLALVTTAEPCHVSQPVCVDPSRPWVLVMALLHCNGVSSLLLLRPSWLAGKLQAFARLYCFSQ